MTSPRPPRQTRWLFLFYLLVPLITLGLLLWIGLARR